MTLAPRGSSVRGRDVRALRANLHKLPCLSAFGLLLLYCACGLKSRTPPIVFMPDGTILELAHQLEMRQGTTISAADRSLIHEQLDHMDGSTRVKRAIEWIEAGQYIPDTDYGMALAVAAVLSGITVAPWAAAERPVVPMVHDVLSGAHRLVDPPELNLDNPWVGVMLARPDVVIGGDRDSKGQWHTQGNYLALESNGHGMQVVLASVPGSGVVSVRSVWASCAQAVEHFQRMGVLQAEPPSQARTLFDPAIAFFA